MERRLQQITDDLGDLKGHMARRIAREMADDIAERLGFELVEALNGQDLRRMLRRHSQSDIDPGTRRSLYQADLVGRVLDPGRQRADHGGGSVRHRGPERRGPGGEERRIPGPVHGGRRSGGVASRQNDREVQELVDNGGLRWFEFSQRDLTPQ